MALTYIGICDLRFKPIFEQFRTEILTDHFQLFSIDIEDWDDPLIFVKMESGVDDIIANLLLSAAESETKQEWHETFLSILGDQDIDIQLVNEIRVCSRLNSILIEYEV